MAVAHGFGAHPLDMGEFREPLVQEFEQALLARGLCANFQEFLFVVEIEWQLGCNLKRQRIAFRHFGWLGLAAVDQFVAFLIEFLKIPPGFERPIARVLLQKFHSAFQIRLVAKDLADAKGRPAYRQDVHAAVIVFLDDFDDLRAAAHLSYALGSRQNNTEEGVVLQAVLDHKTVPWLEDMQRQRRAGKQHHLERKQRDAF